MCLRDALTTNLPISNSSLQYALVGRSKGGLFMVRLFFCLALGFCEGSIELVWACCVFMFLQCHVRDKWAAVCTERERAPVAPRGP